MELIELVKALILGIVEGITEWLPISSSGHMILVNEFLHLNVSRDVWDVFFVVIQFGAIMAVVVLYFHKLFPFYKESGRIQISGETISLWCKIIIACVPAAIVGILFDKKIEEEFYNWQTVSIMLIVFGIIFIVVEMRKIKPRFLTLNTLSYYAVIIIGLFQLVAAILPGTSRSGATIVGALLLGVSRTIATEFTFFLAVPVMLGASLLKIAKYVARFGLSFTGTEVAVLLLGTLTAFVVSLFAIKFLIGYIKKHDFKVFGWYRIVLGVLVIVYFNVIAG
ncbi:undecaprenyl-diphosphatase 1 [Clostridia bacterium]|nr:undecaprenyl-diphosphatase 1 [Clostridia bacterium]